jgi:hypothetical protein
MLIYHPAFDAFHCIFRLLLIIEVNNEIETAKLRIIDFFVLFPAEVRNVRLEKDQLKIKKYAKLLVNRYRGPVNSLQLFRELEHIQAAAVGALAAANLIDKEKLREGVVKRTKIELTGELSEKIKIFFSSLAEIEKFTLHELSAIPLNGIDGLKHRSALMEYRYDNV